MDEWQPVTEGTLADVVGRLYDDPVELPSGVRVPRRLSYSYRHAQTHLEASIAIEVRDGRPTVRRLVVAADDTDARGLDRDRLRTVPLGELARRALARNSWVRGPDGEWHAGTGAGAAASERMAPPGRPLSRADLEEVARVYLQHDGPDPVQAVAAACHLSQSGAAKRVMKARRAGLLPPTTRGKATNREDDR